MIKVLLFIKGDDGKDYYWNSSNIIEDDRRKHIVHGKRLRFYPIELDNDVYMAIGGSGSIRVMY